MSEIIQVNVPNFFYFAEIQKMTKLGPKNRFWGLKIKINLSGIRPNLHPSFFEIQTWYFTSWFIATFSTFFTMYLLKVLHLLDTILLVALEYPEDHPWWHEGQRNQDKAPDICKWVLDPPLHHGAGHVSCHEPGLAWPFCAVCWDWVFVQGLVCALGAPEVPSYQDWLSGVASSLAD